MNIKRELHIALLTGLYLLIANIAFAQTDSTVAKIDFFLSMRDGVKLDCSKFVPKDDTFMPDSGWPVIIYCHGYGDSKDIELNTAYLQAGYGYYTFCYSMRGQGNSGGLSNLISRTEMQDLQEVVKYIKKEKKIVIDTNRIAITGSSQGGIIPYMAACNGLNVRTVMSDLASPVFASNWIENGCVKTTLFFSLDYDSTTVRYNNETQLMKSYILSKEQDKWDSLAALMPKNRDFADQLYLCKVPLLLSNAWQDEFFNATGNMDASAVIKSPFRQYLGAIDGHGSDTSLAENNFLSDYQSDWMDYWLYDEPNHILDSAKFSYASSHFPLNNSMWDFSHFTSDKWEPANITPLKLYFHQNHVLGLNPNINGADTISFENVVLDTSLTMQDALDYEFTGLEFYTSFQKRVIGFETAALKSDMQMVGVPKVNFSYSSDANVCQYNFQIWEIDPGSDAHLVTRINFTNRHNYPGSIQSQTVGGLAHSHIFKAGNRIRVVATNLDTQPADSLLGTNPYVLPVLEPAHNIIYMSKKYLSYLELPIRNITPEDVFPEISDNSSLSVSAYPNPLTDNAVISAKVSISDYYSLDLYDIMGNKIKTLNYSHLDAGEKEFRINLSGLSAGSYFIRLSGGGSSAINGIIKN